MNELLTPTLSESDREMKPLYSQRAHFFTGFFGGVTASIILGAMNAHRLGRLKKDLPLFFIGLFILIGIYLWKVLPPETYDPHWFRELRRSDMLIKYGSRFCAMIVWMISAFLYKKFYKAEMVSGAETPNPWKASILAMFLGGLVEFAILFSIVMVRIGGQA